MKSKENYTFFSKDVYFPQDYGGYDIILIRLARPVPPEAAVPACLPGRGFPDAGVKAQIAGYGKVKNIKSN